MYFHNCAAYFKHNCSVSHSKILSYSTASTHVLIMIEVLGADSWKVLTLGGHQFAYAIERSRITASR